jgi:uncharacterized spore protein YtfJ
MTERRHFLYWGIASGSGTLTKTWRSELPSNGKASATGVTHEQITGVVGEIDDIRVTEIIATGATMGELEEAVAWAARESDVMGAPPPACLPSGRQGLRLAHRGGETG